MTPTLTIGDLTIRPYAYRETEHHSGKGVSIYLRVKLTAEETHRMRGMVHRGQFVSVTGHSRGTPLEMSLGTPEWCQDGEGTRYDLMLYDRAWRAHQPRHLRSQAGAVAYTDGVVQLLLAGWWIRVC